MTQTAPSQTHTQIQTKKQKLESTISATGTVAQQSHGYSAPSEKISITWGGDVPFQEDRNISDPYKQREIIKQHMAGAFRVLGRKGYTEGAAGHITVRDPVDPSTFWMNPLAVHYSLMKASDMVQVDAQGNVVGGSKMTINAAGFKIHSALHKACPEVQAAVHTHSIYGKAYSAFGKPLEMINQDVCVFYKAHDVYDDFGGVVLEDEEGRKIGETLKKNPRNKGLILRNHGLLTVGQTVDEACYLFTLMERSCQAQLMADSVHPENGKKVYVSEEAAEYTYNQVSDSDSLYLEFQPDYHYELAKSKGEFLM